MQFHRTAMALSLLAFATQSCRTVSSDSTSKSGPGGSPTQWTCNELKTEYARLRPQLNDATKTFLRSQSRLGATASSNPSPPPASSTPTPTPAPLPSDPEELKSLIGQGDEAVPALPQPINNFAQIWENSAGIPGRNPVGCDDAYSKYSLSKTNRILEECRYLVKLNNLLINIGAEYNQGRDGECRSGKSETQTEQASMIFPYCKNPCRFGLTACSQCEFMVGRLTSQYICGEEQDARQAVDAYCKSNQCSNAAPICKTDIFNDIAVGSTANKDSTTRATIRQNIGVKFNIEAAAGVTIKSNAGSRIDASIESRVMLKNSRGAPILSVNGGETATTFTCAVTLNSAVVTDVGVELGTGFDLAVVKGGQTITTGGALEAATSYNSQSRDIPAAGASLSSMLDACKQFAIQWGTSDLPALITNNIVLKTVAAKFMGQKKDMYPQDLVTSDTYCQTDKRTSYLFSNYVQYNVTEVWWDLQESSIGFKYHYNGSWFGYNSSVFTFTEQDLGTDRYTNLRQAVFNGTASTEQVRSLIESSYAKGGWLKSCKTSPF